MTRTFLALLHFDGRAFVGWQRQAVGRSVQGDVEGALERLAGGVRVPAHAAGRTDAGVHAVGLGVSFALPGRWTPPAVRRALNALLPADCWAAAVHEMVPGFHARKSALSRRYRYLIGTDAAAASPFRRPFEWALGRPIDLALLQAAGSGITGLHDFQAFAARGQEKPHYRCRVGLAEWRARPGGAGVVLNIRADRFLHHMVRMLVGTMVDVALARRDPGDIARLLASTDNQATSAPAPPHGLYFVEADYPASAYAVPIEETHAALHDA
jgi:tRNA pseudouridine38-40 synthase